MARLVKTIALRRFRWTAVPAVIACLLGAAVGAATPASASSITPGSFTQACNDGAAAQADQVAVSEVYKASEYVLPGQPSTDWSTFFGLNNPDPGAALDSAAYTFALLKCGLSTSLGANDTGWVLRGDDPTFYGTGWAPPDAQGGRDHQVYWTRTIGFQFDPGDPSNQPPSGPGQGAAEINTGTAEDGSGNTASGCSWVVTEKVDAGYNLSINAVPDKQPPCSKSLKGVSVQCFQNGAQVGGKNSTEYISATVNIDLQIPDQADTCTITTWNGSWSGNRIVPAVAYVSTWDPHNGFGNGTWKTLASVTGTHATLNPPQGVHVTASGLVSWNPVAGAAYYAVERDPNTSTAMMQAVDGNQTSFQDTVSDGKAHTYLVAAQPDLFPAQQAWWSPIATEPPVNVRYVQGVASWDPVVAHDQAGGYYNLYINGSKFALVAGTSFTIPASPSASGVSYTMNITSAGLIGNDESDQSAPVKFTYLSPPSGVTAAQSCTFAGPGKPCIPHTAALVQWQNVPGAVSYNIYRNGTKVGSGVANYGGWVDTTVTGGGSAYTYQVTAVAADGSESPMSSQASVAIN